MFIFSFLQGIEMSDTGGWWYKSWHISLIRDWWTLCFSSKPQAASTAEREMFSFGHRLKGLRKESIWKCIDLDLKVAGLERGLFLDWEQKRGWRSLKGSSYQRRALLSCVFRWRNPLLRTLCCACVSFTNSPKQLLCQSRDTILFFFSPSCSCHVCNWFLLNQTEKQWTCWPFSMMWKGGPIQITT